MRVCVCARAHTHIYAHDSNYACRGKKEEGFIAIRTTPVSARVRVIVTRVCVCVCVCARACMNLCIYVCICVCIDDLFTSVAYV